MIETAAMVPAPSTRRIGRGSGRCFGRSRPPAPSSRGPGRGTAVGPGRGTRRRAGLIGGHQSSPGSCSPPPSCSPSSSPSSSSSPWPPVFLVTCTTLTCFLTGALLDDRGRRTLRDMDDLWLRRRLDVHRRGLHPRDRLGGWRIGRRDGEAAATAAATTAPAVGCSALAGAAFGPKPVAANPSARIAAAATLPIRSASRWIDGYLLVDVRAFRSSPLGTLRRSALRLTSLPETGGTRRVAIDGQDHPAATCRQEYRCQHHSTPPHQPRSRMRQVSCRPAHEAREPVSCQSSLGEIFG